jgi:hypothetical protein
MLLGPNLDAGRLGEVMEGLPGLVLGKLGAMEIGADMDAAIGGSGRKLVIYVPKSPPTQQGPPEGRGAGPRPHPSGSLSLI